MRQRRQYLWATCRGRRSEGGTKVGTWRAGALEGGTKGALERRWRAAALEGGGVGGRRRWKAAAGVEGNGVGGQIVLT